MTPQCLRTPCANRPTSSHLSEFTGVPPFLPILQNTPLILHEYCVLQLLPPPAPFSGFLILGRRGLRLCLGYRFYWPSWTNMVRTQHIEGIGIVENRGETVGGGKLRPARYFPPPGVPAAHLSLICRLFSMMDRYLLAPIKWMITC